MSAIRFENPSDDELRSLLTEARTIALVGASGKPERPSYGVMQKLLAAGYRVVPVNPNEREVLGQKAYGALAEVPCPIDVVNVFRRAEHAPAIARQAVEVGAKALWLQLGIESEQAWRIADEAGLVVVMDLCIGVEHSLLRVPEKAPPSSSGC